MTPEFWIVIGLIAVVAIASIRIGYNWGVSSMNKFWVKKMNEDCKTEFMDNYLNAFAKRFEERVDEKSNEIAADKIACFIDNLPEEQQKWFDELRIESEEEK